jgi:hypothetical protein
MTYSLAYSSLDERPWTFLVNLKMRLNFTAAKPFIPLLTASLTNGVNFPIQPLIQTEKHFGIWENIPVCSQPPAGQPGLGLLSGLIAIWS